MIERNKKKGIPEVYRQGDVFLMRVDSIPANAVKQARPERRVVLEHGEQTGHAHAIKAEECDIYLEGTKRFLEVCFKAELNHEEHDTITLLAGNYEVRRQHTWSVLEQMQKVVID